MQWNKELQEYFKSLNVEATFYPSGTVKKFSSIERFHVYYAAELENWNKQDRKFHEIKTFYQGIIDTLVPSNNEKDMEQARIHIDTAIGIAQNNVFPNLPFSSQLFEFFIELAGVGNDEF